MTKVRDRRIGGKGFAGISADIVLYLFALIVIIPFVIMSGYDHLLVLE